MWRLKFTSLKSSAGVHNHDILVLIETKLFSEISDAELGLSNYNVFRYDRSELSSLKASGGGEKITCLSWNCQVECVFV